MSRVVITITQNRTFPGKVYEFAINGPNVRARLGMNAGHDPGAAAAKAMELAIGHGENGYVIFAPDDVMKRIPADMRMKGI